MKTDHRLLHYMLSYLWLPRKGNHGVLTEEDAFVLRVMVEDVKFIWPYLLAHRMMRYTNNSWETHLGHGMLWTKVFEHLNLDLSGEEAIDITEENAITSRSLNKMGRGVVAARKDVMEMFAEKMHAFNIDWDKKMERVDKRLKVVEGRIVAQAKGLQSLEEGMNSHFSRKHNKKFRGVQSRVAVNSPGTLLHVVRMKSGGVTRPLSSYLRHFLLDPRPLRF
ncbi:hypothetical protein PIB30_027866 [Stylosanthes scabra]|uniref:Uncharacterized protein n=1 Tax=Stylosanthes scabra TaxID=79078 RepID=A0ABU6WAH9_9FABA|nr:hypothetical protein [Stylosanthes scabra]